MVDNGCTTESAGMVGNPRRPPVIRVHDIHRGVPHLGDADGSHPLRCRIHGDAPRPMLLEAEGQIAGTRRPDYDVVTVRGRGVGHLGCSAFGATEGVAREKDQYTHVESPTVLTNRTRAVRADGAAIARARPAFFPRPAVVSTQREAGRVRSEAGRASLLGVRVSILTRQALLRTLEDWVGSGTRRLCYANAHVLNLALRDSRLRDALNRADVVLCEGVGGRIGSAIAGTEPRVATSLNTMTWIDDYFDLLARRGARVFLVGDEAPVLAACVDEMGMNHPDLRVVGTHHGFFDRHGPDNERVLDEIRRSDAHVLIVGMGTPIQEFWIEDNLEDLPGMNILALGAMFRWYSGVERPWFDWMLRFHLGWLGRLVRHPVRHFRRYVIGNPLFLWRCLRQRWGQRT